MRQNKQEVKQDYKEMEGNPEIKGRRRMNALIDLFSSPQRALKRSTVVVTNPTHIAVALRYDPSGDAPVPVITFKGQNELALLLRRLAREERVPIIENVALARSLYASTDADDTVPVELFDAVADVLIWVQQLNTSDPQQ
ncbi:MAG TPA: EscU/YscU/HrcU family type III secretion system export apparatus switch protein, partial [Burkholderiaceae bacterium]|nr:EscU/YscU/HrcU family type III secretion system export apparatus switch protein [Burkholderiaceae bacterium]